jgi:hypothetical protein
MCEAIVNTDGTEAILRKWVEENRKWYRFVVEDYTRIAEPVEHYDVHRVESSTL